MSGETYPIMAERSSGKFSPDPLTLCFPKPRDCPQRGGQGIARFAAQQGQPCLSPTVGSMWRFSANEELNCLPLLSMPGQISKD